MKYYNPTTPSRRTMTGTDYKKVLTKVAPEKALILPLKKRAGRNNQGRITVRHKGGGNKKMYRLIDFRQDKFDIPGRIASIEYDPCRNAFISLVVYKDGEKRYILAPEGVKKGDSIITASQSADFLAGNRMMLKNIPIGTLAHNIEIIPGSGGVLARSAGNYAKVMGFDKGYAILQLPSKETRMVKENCYASIGQVSNPEHNTLTIGKAGRTRWLGIRPTVRGTAMNPCDHPYGGGEGRQPRGTKRPKTKWGKVTGGHKTRKKKKWSNKLILKRRR